MSSVYVPVRLDDYANDQQGAAFAAHAITLRGIPFDLVARDGADNLFLHQAGWPDWQEDPSKYYAAYDTAPAAPDPRRPFFQIPVADYECVYLLAAADPSPEFSRTVTFRIGAWEGGKRTTFHDVAAVVPRSNEKTGANVLQVVPTPAGNVFLMAVPLGLAIGQDFADRLALDVEVTKEVRLAVRRPDPARYQLRPLGLPSGVRIYGMTFARSPIQMTVTTDETGHVFNEPQTPAFQVRLRNVHPAGPTRRLPCTVEATATDLCSGEVVAQRVEVTPERMTPEAQVTVALPVKRRGAYSVVLSVQSGKTTLLTRRTSMALLAPDTRQHRAQAPWGVWDFCGGHYSPNRPDLTGPLYVKAGLRYGMFHYSEEARRPYGVLVGNEPKAKDAAAVADLAKKVAEGAAASPPRWLIFHEDAISGAHITRTPDLFTGRAPYKLDEKESKRFQEMWDGALASCRAIRERFPKAEIYFGNGNVHLLEEFLKKGLPRELIDARGNEAASFQRLPETQPCDIVANNASLWMDRQVLDHYGYKDVPVAQCYEICYPSTNPGNLTQRTQAAYLVRHAMHSSVWGVPLIRFSCIADVGNSYYCSNWGSSGLCTSQPDVAPKVAYAAVAAMTQLLDGAKFSRVVPCAAPTVYAVEFARPAGGFVTCLWTVRGTRTVTLELPATDDAARTADMMGNESPLTFKDRRAVAQVAAEPCYVLSARPLAALEAGPAVLEGKPDAKSFLISALDRMAEWRVETGRDAELEVYNPFCPRRKGDFRYREVAAFEGREKALEVKPQLPVAESVHLPMYSALRHSTGVVIPGAPTEIGLMVNGNGGWGRVIFELEDASGQRWISIGCEQKGAPTQWMADWLPREEFAALKSSNLADWNTDDAWGRSCINFEGWRYVRFPLPGNYPGEGYHWPYSSQWRFSGDGVVKYPLKFTRLIITLPEKVLRFREYAPVARPEVYLKDLVVTYDPPEKAFHAE